MLWHFQESGLNAPSQAVLTLCVVHFKVLNQPKKWDDKLTLKHTDYAFTLLSRLSYVKTYTDVSHFIQDSA